MAAAGPRFSSPDGEINEDGDYRDRNKDPQANGDWLTTVRA